ncbi:hypothetical protein ACEPAF_147 [Sanghuangporus sanghuang]
MLSIEKANKNLSEAWGNYQKIRQKHFAILDDSDDDDPFIQSAEADNSQLELTVQKFSRRPNNIFSILGRRIPQKESNRAIESRNLVKDQIVTYSDMFDVSSRRRETLAQTSDLQRYAFNTNHLSSSHSFISTTKAVRPRFHWRLRFRQVGLNLVDTALESIWTELDCDEERLQKWWIRNRPPESTDDSEGWKDMKRLSRRVAIQILERVEKSDLQKSPHIQQLERVAEMCRETVLFQAIFCFNIRQSDLVSFQEIVEYTIPVIFLTSEVIYLAWSVAHQNLGIAGNYRVETQLQKLTPYVTELRNMCYRFGRSVGFDVRKYWDDFMAGAISNTREGSASTYQLYLSRGSVGGLKMDILLDMGLQQFTDIVYDTRNHKGEGAYADVYEMKRNGEMKPVAVKRCKPGPKSAKRVEREARNWIGLHHKHIAPLLGFVCFDVSLSLQPCLVSELYHTDLKKLVWKYGKSAGSPLEHNSYVLTEERKLKFLRDISYALEFMHASNTVHGDLRAANILVTNESLDDPSCYAVLNDFGMAEYYDDDIDQIQRLSSVNMQTSAPWLAPELFEIAPRQNSLARVSKEGDVYAFGAVFLEVVYERDPYQGSPYSIEHAKSIGELPARKEDLEIRDELHWWLMEACWESVEKRPSMVEIGKQHLDIIFRFPPEKPVRHAI